MNKLTSLNKAGRMKWLVRLNIALFLLFVAASPQAWSLTILTNYTGGTPKPNMFGGGNIEEIFRAAADIWELAISDSHVLTLHYGWGPERSNHRLISQGGIPNRETEGRITFDNDTNSLSFMDPTPKMNEEWVTYTELSDDLGGGQINIGRYFSDPIGFPPIPLEYAGFLPHDFFSFLYSS